MQKQLLKRPWFWLLVATLFGFLLLMTAEPCLGLLAMILPDDWYRSFEESYIGRNSLYPHFYGFAVFFGWLLLAAIAFFSHHPPVVASGYLLLALVSLPLLLPAISCPGRESGKRLSCSGNLKQIYTSLITYAQDFDGCLPPDLQTLHDSEYLTDLSVYRCPSQPIPAKEFSDYLYFGNGRKLTDRPFLLLRDRHRNHPGMYINCMMSGAGIHNGYREYSPGTAPGE